MASFYGKHWIAMWQDIPLDSVKAEWQSKLTGMSSKVVFGAVDYCAENLKFPPTLPEFVGICKAKTHQEVTRFLEKKLTDDEMQSNKKRIEKISSDLSKQKTTGYRDWIKQILANHKNYPDISLKYALEVQAMGAN